jgi:hypothetical protein
MRVRAAMPDDQEPRPRAWSIALAGYVAIAAYLVVTRDLCASVPHFLAGEMRDALWMIAAELFAIAVVWSAPGAMSLSARAAITCVGCVPAVLFVVVFGYFGDVLRDHYRERMAIDLHVAWLGYAIVWSQIAGLVMPAALVIRDAVRSYCARSE